MTEVGTSYQPKTCWRCLKRLHGGKHIMGQARPVPLHFKCQDGFAHFVELKRQSPCGLEAQDTKHRIAEEEAGIRGARRKL